MGILVSKKEVHALGIRENDDVVIQIEKKGNPLRELFGTLQFSKPTAELLKESRKNTSKHWD